MIYEKLYIFTDIDFSISCKLEITKNKKKVQYLTYIK